AIAVNPRNPNQQFVATNDNAGNFMYASVSADGGRTWRARIIATGADIPAGFTDPSVSWDNFGNLFFTYINTAATDVVVTLSTDGGNTFQAIATLPCQDQPTLVTGAVAARV